MASQSFHVLCTIQAGPDGVRQRDCTSTKALTTCVSESSLSVMKPVLRAYSTRTWPSGRSQNGRVGEKLLGRQGSQTTTRNSQAISKILTRHRPLEQIQRWALSRSSVLRRRA